MQPLGIDGHWLGVHAADPRAVALYRRHYSVRDRLDHDHRRNGIVGPSERMILLTVGGDALWAWRLMLPPEKRISQMTRPDQRRLRRGLSVGQQTSSYFGGQVGIMCSVFRNEGPILSSILILEAEQLAWQRWPRQRLFTYVWDARIKSVNPGYCFKIAGWQYCGRTADGRLSILEKLPLEAS